MLQLVAIALLGLAACIPSPTPTLTPSDPVEPTAAQWPAAALNAQQADGTLAGQIVELKEDWTYDDPCGLVKIVMHGCDGTVTYRVKVANTADHHYIWAFTPAYGVFGLHVGELATFLWHTKPVFRYFECREHSGMGGWCDYDIRDTFQSDFDILPIADSSIVDSIRSQRSR